MSSVKKTNKILFPQKKPNNYKFISTTVKESESEIKL